MISIVVPALNEEKYIGTLLNSILKQGFKEPIEIVVADAGSTDGTRDVVRSFEGKFAKVSIVEGGVPPVARNHGARASSGDPIIFMDADVTAPSITFLTTTIKHFRDHHLAVAIPLILPKSDKFIDALMFGSVNVLTRVAKYIRPLGSICVIVTREVFEKTGGYPEDRFQSEEHDFVLACLKFGAYDIVPEPLLVSVRRLNKEGRLGLALKYTYSALYRVFVGPVTKPIFAYEFKYTDKEASGK